MSGKSARVAASVIIPCRDSTGTLGLQLEALANQVDAPAFEVVIADNGSKDGLEAFLDTWRPRLTLRRVDASAAPGAAYARNVGIAAAATDTLLFCDSDDVVARDWVARGCEALATVEAFSGPGLQVPDADVGRDLADAWRRLDAALPPGAPPRPGDRVAWPVILGGNSGLRRSVIEAVGGYDASLRGDVEDNDLALRLQDAGYPIAGAPGVRIVYRVRSGARQAFSGSRRRGIAHVELCERHSAWSRSPVLAGGRWRWEPVRVIGSGARMLMRPATRDAEGLASRAGLAVGVYQGWLRTKLGRGAPPPAIGAGLETGVQLASLLERPVLILSPHLDDALFSASELVRRASPDVWTVFAGEPDPPVTTEWDLSCGFRDSHEALTVRTREDAAAFAGTSASVRRLACLDGPYTTPERRREDLALLVHEVGEWVEANAAARPIVVLPAGAGVPVAANPGRAAAGDPPLAERGSRSAVGAVLHLARRLKHAVYVRRRRRAQSRGLAVNNDHLAVRDAVGAALADDPRVILVLSEELPYLWWHAADDAVAAAAKRWRRWPQVVSLAVDRPWKHDRVRHYVSQLDVMDAAERRLGAAGALPPVERLWVLRPRA